MESPFSFAGEGKPLRDQEDNHRKPSGNASGRCQHVPAMAPRAIYAGGAPLGDQGRVKLGRIRIGAGQSSARTLSIGLKRISAGTGETR